ncbi:MAG: Vms1/Ankzf1 family peptidyl-tRNA hydrolase [Methanothrix sp.]|nr:Vms1/Ankzf1 family peptidyl-tRNA hydrolase [Methanothrix sp.]
MDLFGRRKLEERIRELESNAARLEDEKEKLQQALERKEERISRLSAAYQEANLALKALQRAAEPPAAPERKEDDEGRRPLAERLRPSEIKDLMRRLEHCRSPEDDLLTALIPEGEMPPAGMDAPSLRSGRGWLILRYPRLFTLLLVPPFPVDRRAIYEGESFQIEDVRRMLETPAIVVSAHAGDTLLGVALGSEGFQVLERVESQVKEKHSKGGWSQRRFERLRDEDIKSHLDQVLLRLSEMTKSYGTAIKFVVLGGDQALVRRILPEVRLPAIERRLERHDPRRPDQLIDDLYGFKCYRI